MRKTFRSCDFTFRPANGIAAAFARAGAHVPMVREPLIQVNGKQSTPHQGG
jgi:hypothetical protein